MDKVVVDLEKNTSDQKIHSITTSAIVRASIHGEGGLLELSIFHVKITKTPLILAQKFILHFTSIMFTAERFLLAGYFFLLVF